MTDGTGMTEGRVEPVRLLVADDHPVYRDGLRLLLGDREGIEVVGTATTGGEAVERAASTDPDVVIMDLRMPNLNGIERSEEHTSELQSHVNLVCRLLLEKKKKK